MKNLFSRLLMVMALFVITHTASASHIAGMDLTYKYISPNVYEVTLKFYRDCYGIPMSGSSSVCYGSNSLGITNYVNLPAVDTNIVTPICVGQLTTCEGGTAYGVEEHVYRGNVTLPQAATDWVFSFTTCCRNQAITTLQNAQAEGIWVGATLDNINFPTNSSPSFTSLPVTQFCINSLNYFPQYASDIDGDSLYFALVDPYSDGGTCTTPGNPVLFNSPFSGINPLTTSAPFTVLDPFTGLITLTPILFEIGVMALDLMEYDSVGTLKSTIRRDIQVSVVQCNFAQFQTTIVNGVPKAYAANCGDSCVTLQLTDSIQCSTVAPNGSDFRAVRPNGQPNPIYSATPLNCNNGLTTQIQICFYKPLTQGTSKFWLKTGNDLNTLLPSCGNALPEYDTINIVVFDPSIMALPVIDTVPSCAFTTYTITMPELITCASIAANGSDFILKDATGTPYPVTSASGVNCSFQNEFTNQITITLNAPAQGTPPYYLIATNGNDGNTITNECDKPIDQNDTIAILYTTNTVTVSLGTDTTLCQNDPAPVLDATLTLATYTWYLNGAPVGGNTQTLTANQSGTYICQVSYGPNCFGSDTVVVNYVLAPVVALGNDLAVCNAAPFPTLDAGNPGSTYVWTDINGNPLATTQTYTPTAAGTYIVTVSGGSCSSSDTINVTVSNATAFTLGNDDVICETASTTITSSVAGSSYVWFKDGTNLNTNAQTITVNAAGTYVCELTNTDGCKSTDTIIVTTEALPAKPQVFCGVATGTGFSIVYTWAPIAGATGYAVSVNGAPFVPNNLLPVSHGLNSSPASFIVHALGTECEFGPNSDPAFCDISIPNIVTPNNDGKNDAFVILNLEQFSNARMKIYNRWGNLIYENANYKNDFNFQDQPDGVYYYVLTISEVSKDYTGNVTVYKEKK